MRLASMKPNKLAVIKDGMSVPLEQALLKAGGLPPHPTMRDLIENFGALKEQIERAAEVGTPVRLDPTQLLPPVENPSKIWAAAGNYKRGSQGLEEGRGRGVAQTQDKAEKLEMIFLKPPSAITGPEQAIVIPKGADTIFPELELCAVIGKETRNVSKEQALEAVFGYTIILDVTARGYGFAKNGLATRNIRKGFATFAPIGPWITTADEIQNPMQLTMRLWVNEELVQAAKTDAMINDVSELISYLSKVGALCPGDLIATGNPDAPDFQRKLEDGDRLTAEIDGIGKMNLSVQSEATPK